MVRFSCFQTHVHSQKHKKTVQQSSEAMQKMLEDSSSRSEEADGKYSNDCDIAVLQKAQIRKSRSLGSGLNWEEKTSCPDGSEEGLEQPFSHDGSADCSRTVVPDSINNNGPSLSDQFQEPMPSDFVQADSDFAKNMAIFSIGGPDQTEKEGADQYGVSVSDEIAFGDIILHTPHVIVKSTSLPRMGSPNRCSRSFLAHCRSAEDMNTLDSRKKGMMHEVGRQVQYHERDSSMRQNDKNIDENPADETDENYNYVDSAKDWIIPVSDEKNMEKDIKEKTYFHHLDEVPSEDVRLKRIEEWVMNLQQCGPLEESNESAPCYDQELSKGNALLQEPTVSKLELKVDPGIEAAKIYISSLNPSATAAQLTNLGLVVIPFLSAFGSLKALNLSGNAIVRIAAGALPRGLHILNLSKNNISTIEGLRDLTRLRVLDFSYNRILRIGHGLSACSSIKELYLAGNKIGDIEGLHRLLKLNVLDLRFNKISTTKCLGQLAGNYNCLHALSLEGNPAQKNVGDEQLKKYVLSLLPHLTYYNRQSIKVGTMKDAADRSARLGISSHQIDRSLRVEAKTMRKGTHAMAAQKAASFSNHGRKGQALASPPKPTRGRHGRLPPSGMKTVSQGHQFTDLSSKLLSLRNDFSIPRSRSEGNLGAF